MIPPRRPPLTVLTDGAADPAACLALEEELLGRAAAGEALLLLWSSPRPAVILGHGQPDSDVDPEACRELGLPVLRRITGGTGVIHDGDLALSLALAADHPFARGIVGLYGRFLDVLAAVLAAHGAAVERPAVPPRASRRRSPICFEDRLADTLLVNGRKAVGCAQARRARSVLVHGAVLLHPDPALHARIFRVAETRVAAALGPALPGASAPELFGPLAEAFAEALARRE